MLLSAWPQENNQTIFYGVKQWEVNLNGGWDWGSTGSLGGLSVTHPATEGIAPEHTIATDGYVGDLAPDLSKLPVEEQVAILADSTDSDIDRAFLRDALNGTIKDTRPTPAERYAHTPPTEQ